MGLEMKTPMEVVQSYWLENISFHKNTKAQKHFKVICFRVFVFSCFCS
jgi:hypothetical protein